MTTGTRPAAAVTTSAMKGTGVWAFTMSGCSARMTWRSIQSHRGFTGVLKMTFQIGSRQTV